jgi:hypothetical protein
MGANQLRNLSANAALRIVVDFADVDVDGLTARQLATVERQVQAVIHRESPPTQVRTGAIDRRTLRVMQASAREALASITSSEAQRLAAIAGDLVLSYYVFREGTAVRLLVMGSVLDRWMYQIVRVLEAVGVEKLRACPAPRPGEPSTECGRFFLKVTVKKCCSTRCQSRMYMRGYRA